MAAPKGRYTSFESTLHRLLHERLDLVMAERAMQLAGGAARKGDTAATAAAYHEELGYIRALRECQGMCQEIAADLARDG